MQSNRELGDGAELDQASSEGVMWASVCARSRVGVRGSM